MVMFLVLILYFECRGLLDLLIIMSILGIFFWTILGIDVVNCNIIKVWYPIQIGTFGGSLNVIPPTFEDFETCIQNPKKIQICAEESERVSEVYTLYEGFGAWIQIRTPDPEELSEVINVYRTLNGSRSSLWSHTWIQNSTCIHVHALMSILEEKWFF